MRLLFSLFLLAGWVGVQNYSPALLEQIANNETPEHVRVWGRFYPDGEAQAHVRGHLKSSPYHLRVEGAVFDWRPQPGQLVEMWGRLELTATGYRLRFHNGRKPGEARHPRPTPTLQEGAQIRLWLKVTEAGTKPFPVMQGVTEDRRVFLLPGYGAHGARLPKWENGFFGTTQWLASNTGGR